MFLETGGCLATAKTRQGTVIDIVLADSAHAACFQNPIFVRSFLFKTCASPLQADKFLNKVTHAK